MSQHRHTSKRSLIRAFKRPVLCILSGSLPAFLAALQACWRQADGASDSVAGLRASLPQAGKAHTAPLPAPKRPMGRNNADGPPCPMCATPPPRSSADTQV
ncbi:hypothetical protein NBRC116594_39790 [Shimia sp. NS0008-38b]